MKTFPPNKKKKNPFFLFQMEIVQKKKKIQFSSLHCSTVIVYMYVCVYIKWVSPFISIHFHPLRLFSFPSQTFLCLVIFFFFSSHKEKSLRNKKFMSHAAPKAECWMQVLGEGGRERASMWVGVCQ